MARVAEAESGLAAEAQAHADLPKHAFGSCSICTRRLLSVTQQSSATTGAPHARTALPTRFLVQTTPVAEHSDGGL